MPAKRLAIIVTEKPRELQGQSVPYYYMFMVSQLFTGGSYEKRLEHTHDFLKTHQIDPLDQSFFSSDDKNDENLTGIALVRQLRHQALLRPLRGNKKAIVLFEANTLSHPAQNALLKLLEEPPEHTVFILTTSQKELLLPTILSRCQTVSIAQDQLGPGNLIKTLPVSVGERLVLAQMLAENDPVQNVGDTINELHRLLTQTLSTDNLSQLENIVSLLLLLHHSREQLLTTNLNPRTILERSLLM